MLCSSLLANGNGKVEFFEKALSSEMVMSYRFFNWLDDPMPVSQAIIQVTQLTAEMRQIKAKNVIVTGM